MDSGWILHVPFIPNLPRATLRAKCRRVLSDPRCVKFRVIPRRPSRDADDCGKRRSSDQNTQVSPWPPIYFKRQEQRCWANQQQSKIDKDQIRSDGTAGRFSKAARSSDNPGKAVEASWKYLYVRGWTSSEAHLRNSEKILKLLERDGVSIQTHHQTV